MTFFKLFSCLLILVPVANVAAKDVFLTIGGGAGPSSNQVSLEKNVLLLNRTLQELDVDYSSNDIFFSDGESQERDVKVVDPDSLPKANRLMAEFFGDQENLGLRYRDHQIPHVRGPTSPANIRNWFSTNGSSLGSGDRLVVYVTAHGHKGDADHSKYDTTIAMWDNKSLKMTEFVELLDGLQPDVDVVVVMVQCYAGGFARFIFNEGNPKKGLSPQRRIGFFATVHDKPASGCTAEVDEANYAEYSSYFWAAFTGTDRTGQPLKRPDYNSDGRISFDEAHAYTLIESDTVDIPMKTSGEFLSVHGAYGEDDPELLSEAEPYSAIIRFATPSQRAVLDGLSKQLDLSGDDRVATAFRETEVRRGRGRTRGGGRGRDAERLKNRIVTNIKRRWPELSNVLNPLATEFLTNRKEEFIEVIESHRDYKRYRDLADSAAKSSASEKRRAKFNRFVRTADNVLFAQNLKRTDPEKYTQYVAYVAIVAGESRWLSR